MAEEIKVIDVMSYPPGREMVGPMMESNEGKVLFSRFKGKLPGVYGMEAEEMIAAMDEAGFEKTFLAAMKMWSHRDNKLIWAPPVEKVYELTQKYPGRFVGLAGYNPFRIKDSLDELEKAVKEYGFKGVYAHTLGFGIPPNDRRMYPCYAKCVDLGIPFALQVGHSAEIMPSEPGRPIYLDEVALDFPELTIIGSHTGYPWCEEMIALASKFPNVYADCSAWPPRMLNKSFVEFMGRVGRSKVLFGTNGLGFKDIKEEFLQLGLKEEVNRAIFRENAVKVYKL